MDLDELLGIDPDDLTDQNAEQLVEADEKLLDDLVALRESRSLTQQDVADMLQVKVSAIARIESGERNPRLSTLRRYAVAIGARVEHRVSDFTCTHPVPAWPAVMPGLWRHGPTHDQTHDLDAETAVALLSWWKPSSPPHGDDSASGHPAELWFGSGVISR